MAPEVIQETSYDSKADIWSLGITILEMCEGRPPHFNVHPMRAIFIIPKKPAPQLQEPTNWSLEMNNFVGKCLVKEADQRASAEELLSDPWIISDVEIARIGGGTKCLRAIVSIQGEAINNSRRRQDSLHSGTMGGRAGRAGNEAFRNRIRSELESAKLVDSAVICGTSSVIMSRVVSNLSLGTAASVVNSNYLTSVKQATAKKQVSDLSNEPHYAISGTMTSRDSFRHSSSFQSLDSHLNGPIARGGPHDMGTLRRRSNSRRDSTKSDRVYAENNLIKQMDSIDSNDSFLKSGYDAELESIDGLLARVTEIVDYKDKSIHTDTDPNDIYDFKQLLGEGSYGLVYKGENILTEEAVAIKVLPIMNQLDLGSEIDFLRRLSSPYTVSFHQAFLHWRELWIVMEFCAGGSLSDILRYGKKSLDEPQLMGVIASCVLGLSYMHSMMSIHRDIKAGNVLLTSDGRAKLADFGVSAQLSSFNEKRHTLIGTSFWMSPEVIQEFAYDFKADIWSLGITILETCEGHPPHFDLHPMQAVFLIPMKPAPRLNVPELWSVLMNDFICRCLVKEPEKRASISELLNHEWLTQTMSLLELGQGLPELRDFLINNLEMIEHFRSQRVFRREKMRPTRDSYELPFITERSASKDENDGNFAFNMSPSLAQSGAYLFKGANHSEEGRQEKDTEPVIPSGLVTSSIWGRYYSGLKNVFQFPLLGKNVDNDSTINVGTPPVKMEKSPAVVRPTRRTSFVSSPVINRIEILATSQLSRQEIVMKQVLSDMNENTRSLSAPISMEVFMDYLYITHHMTRSVVRNTIAEGKPSSCSILKI
jgi:serine/threonine protein kinase